MKAKLQLARSVGGRGFAWQKRYRKIVLWTNRTLDAARHIYQSFGLQMVKQGKLRAFGKNLVEQT